MKLSNAMFSGNVDGHFFYAGLAGTRPLPRRLRVHIDKRHHEGIARKVWGIRSLLSRDVRTGGQAIALMDGLKKFRDSGYDEETNYSETEGLCGIYLMAYFPDLPSVLAGDTTASKEIRTKYPWAMQAVSIAFWEQSPESMEEAQSLFRKWNSTHKSVAPLVRGAACKLAFHYRTVMLLRQMAKKGEHRPQPEDALKMIERVLAERLGSCRAGGEHRAKRVPVRLPGDAEFGDLEYLKKLLIALESSGRRDLHVGEILAQAVAEMESQKVLCSHAKTRLLRLGESDDATSIREILEKTMGIFCTNDITPDAARKAIERFDKAMQANRAI